MNLTPLITPRSFGTHDGAFHADEVTACSLLLQFDLIDRSAITRSRNNQILSYCQYLCDVGGVYDTQKLRFDHHQVEYSGLMSSAGMILLYLLEQAHISKEMYDFLNQTLVRSVDEHDIGVAPNVPGLTSFSHIIANFNPVEYEASQQERLTAFMQAVDFTCGHLKRLCEKQNYTRLCRDAVQRAMSKYTEYLVFDSPLPWLENFFLLGGEQHPAKFVIMPADKNWKLRGIPPALSDRMNVRIPMPAEWGGLLDCQLQAVSKIPGAIFCHKGLFISVWRTREDAFEAMKYALDIQTKGS